MPKRTSPTDARDLTAADDLKFLVQDKREGWRANGATARRRRRRYENLLTQHVIMTNSVTGED